MLVINDHDSNMTIEFLDFVTKYNILSFTFSSHVTYLLQSLNIDVFQLFKHWHAQSVDTTMRYDEIEFKKLDFFVLFSTMHTQIMILRTISHLKEKTNLLSYNSSVVLDKIKVLKQRHREKISSIAFSSVLKRTSKNYKEIINYDQWLLNISKRIYISSDFPLTLKRHIKGSIVIVYFREILKSDLNDVQLTQLIRRERVSLSSIIATKSDVVIVDIIRAKKQKRVENDVKKTKQAIKIAKARLLKKQLKKEK